MSKLKKRKVYLCLLALFGICFLIRASNVPLPGFFMSHISNFAITGGLVILSNDGFLFNKSVTRRKLLLDLLPFAILNIVIELFVRVDTLKIGSVEFVNFNTPDVIDMVYGLASLALIYFVLTKYAITSSKQTHPKTI